MGKDLDGLLIAARGGDAAAYEEIVRRFQRMAIAYGAGVLRDFHLAQDVAQEAFVEAYFKLGALRNLGAIPAWLRKIIFKHCYRRRRRKKMQGRSAEQMENHYLLCQKNIQRLRRARRKPGARQYAAY